MIVATTDADITVGATINKVDTLSSISKVYDDQKLIIADKYLRNTTEVTANGEQNSGATQINFDNVTPTTNYSKGSFLLLKPNDLSNVITSGGSTSPGGFNTQVQYNNNGSFGGTDLLKITGANELTIGGTNTNTKLNAGADIILGADVAGGTTTIQYLDSGNTNRLDLMIVLQIL